MTSSPTFHSIPCQDSGKVADLKLEHLHTLAAPLDAYWEGAIIGFANHHELHVNGTRAGYYCTNDDKQLVAFFLNPENARHGGQTLTYLIKEVGISGALVGTNDPHFLSLCLDRPGNVEVHTLLFEDNRKVDLELNDFDGLAFHEGTQDDFDDILEHYFATSGSMDLDSVEAAFEGIKGYVQSVMTDHKIFVLRSGGELIATSECRISQTQTPFADVGMIVSEKHRKKGVGAYILARTKEYCYEKNTKPICSCESGNIGSRRAISRAGFVARHRVVLKEFLPDS